MAGPLANRQPLRKGHPYHMHDAILAQPNAMERVLLSEAGAVRRLANLAKNSAVVHLVGIGSSWHAALVGAYLLRSLGGRTDALAWNAQEFCISPPPLKSETLVIVLSHGGSRRYSLQALARTREAGSPTGIVTGIGSEIADGAADVVVRTSNRDPSAAFTVSHTSALTALAMLAVMVGESDGVAAAADTRPALDQLHVLTEWTIATEMAVRALAADLSDSRVVVFVGAGPNEATAYEAALKTAEASRIPSMGFQAEQFLHGPFVALEPGDAVVALVTHGAERDRILDVVGAASAAGANTVVLADESDHEAFAIARSGVSLPAVPSALTPIAYLGPLQLLAYWLAVQRGVNPDLFRRDDPTHQQVWERYSLS